MDRWRKFSAVCVTRASEEPVDSHAISQPQTHCCVLRKGPAACQQAPCSVDEVRACRSSCVPSPLSHPHVSTQTLMATPPGWASESTLGPVLSAQRSTSFLRRDGEKASGFSSHESETTFDLFPESHSIRSHPRRIGLVSLLTSGRQRPVIFEPNVRSLVTSPSMFNPLRSFSS